MFGGGGADLGGFGGYGGFGGFGASQAGGFGGGGGMTQGMAGGGGGGGGFYTSPARQSVGGFGGPASPGTARSRVDYSAKESMGLIPVTVAMVANAVGELEVGENNPKFHGKEVSMAEIVGAVVDIQRKNENALEYTIDDGTGCILAKRYLDGGLSTLGAPGEDIQIGQYVTVVGPVKRFSTETAITAHKMEPITSPDRIAYHIIAVSHAMVMLTEEIPNMKASLQNSGNAQSSGQQQHHHAAVKQQDVLGGFGGTNYQTQSHQSLMQRNSSIGGNAILGRARQMLIPELRAAFGGMMAAFSRQQVIMRFNTRFSMDEINQMLQALTDDGQLYTTEDDDHFKMSGV
ncbi:replication factor A protein 2 [Perkinsus chesapeaki]|uniref:Replication factor A protein 2 n=1 Tax=Perkinsus chesapeaki TaxID=330153 RepID=A0A7J6M008_PERCH|nr:replication factor A protein 2 [Perkinsus chesapeaki]